MCVSSHKLLVLPFLSGERFLCFFLMKAVLIWFSSLPVMTIFDICVTLRQFMLMELFRFVLPFSYSCLPSMVSYMVSNFPLIYASLEIDKVTTKQMNEAVREGLQHQQSDAVWQRKRKAYAHFTNEQQAAIGKYTQPKMIIVLPLRSLRASLMGNWEKAQSTYSSRSTTKKWRKQRRELLKEKQSIPSKRKGCPSDSGREWPAGASLDKGTHESWHPSEYPSCAGSCCGRDSQNSTSTITSWDQMGIQLVPTSNLTVEECGAKIVEIAAGHCHIGRHSLRGAFTTTGHFPREDWKGPPHIRFSQWLCVAHPKPLGKWRNDISLHWEHPHTLH